MAWNAINAKGDKPLPCSLHSSFGIASKIYVFGGDKGGSGVSNEVFSLETGLFSIFFFF